MYEDGFPSPNTPALKQEAWYTSLSDRRCARKSNRSRRPQNRWFRLFRSELPSVDWKEEKRTSAMAAKITKRCRSGTPKAAAPSARKMPLWRKSHTGTHIKLKTVRGLALRRPGATPTSCCHGMNRAKQSQGALNKDNPASVPRVSGSDKLGSATVPVSCHTLML